MFQTSFMERMKTHILFSVTFYFFRKSCRLWNNVENYCWSRQATWRYDACALHT